jgi:hypothetical protein
VPHHRTSREHELERYFLEAQGALFRAAMFVRHSAPACFDWAAGDIDFLLTLQSGWRFQRSCSFGGTGDVGKFVPSKAQAIHRNNGRRTDALSDSLNGTYSHRKSTAFHRSLALFREQTC